MAHRGTRMCNGRCKVIANRWNPLGKDFSTPAMRYVQDGLIAHWDALENIGYGKRDATAKVWRDLISGTDMIGTDGVEWGDNFYLGQKGKNWYQAIADRQDLYDCYASGKFTIEAVIGVDPTLYPASDTYPFYLGASNDSLRLYCKTNQRNGGWWFSNSYTIDRYMVDAPLHTLSVMLDITKTEGDNALIYNDALRTYSYIGATSARGNLGSYLYIGRCHAVGSGFTYFAGKMHAIRWYNRALDLEELTYNRTIDIERFGL